MVYRELDRFTDKANATERTVRALGNVGFTVMQHADEIDGVRVETYSGSTSAGPDPVEIAAKYVDPTTGNTITLGMDINGYDVQRGPYDWTGNTTSVMNGQELAGAGNHDNNQPEAVRQLVYLLAAAHYDTPTGSLPVWTPEYKAWEESVLAQLAPMQYEESITPSA